MSKRLAWGLPISAAIIVGGWMAYSSYRTAEMKRQLKDLGQRAKLLSIGHAQHDETKAQTAQKAEKKIDWKKISSISPGNGGIRDGLELVRLQELLKGMNLEELLTQLDAIEKTEISSELKMKLRELLFSHLAKMSPELACQLYVDCLRSDGQVRTFFPFTFRNWFQKDPIAATAWLNQQIQQGMLEPKSLKPDFSTWASLESTVLAQLMSTDPAAATERASKMPEDLKKVLFRELALNRALTLENAGDYVAMARSILSKEDAPGTVAEVLAGFVGKDSDFSRVDQLLTAASASSEEKRATVTKAFSFAVSGADWKMDQLTKATDWLKSSEPQDADEITGAALSMAAQQTRSYEQAMKLAQAYQEQTGNDAVMVAFLKTSAGDQVFSPKTKDMISCIKDPERRAEMEQIYRK